MNRRETIEFLRSQRLGMVVRAQAEHVANRARAIAPHRTGRYRASITTDLSHHWTDRRWVGEVSAQAPYAAAVEFGNTRVEGAHHVLARAAAEG